MAFAPCSAIPFSWRERGLNLWWQNSQHLAACWCVDAPMDSHPKASCSQPGILVTVSAAAGLEEYRGLWGWCVCPGACATWITSAHRNWTWMESKNQGIEIHCSFSGDLISRTVARKIQCFRVFPVFCVFGLLCVLFCFAIQANTPNVCTIFQWIHSTFSCNYGYRCCKLHLQLQKPLEFN